MPRLSHALSGADLWTLARLYARSGGVAWSRAPQAAFAALSSLGRAPFTAFEHLALGRATAREEIEAPIFILGHWRSGTTHLYNILCKSDQFTFVPPIATGLPWELRTLASWLKPMLEKALPEDRYIDNIPVNPDSPQEDEIGIANMTTLSFYHAIYFPKRFDRLLDRGVFFDGASPGLIKEWERAVLRYFKKLSATQGRKRLLIKNPVYTARPAMLERMFPDARFVHIRRNPYEVFASMRNFYAKLLNEMALQDFGAVDVDDAILRTYARMMRIFDAETANFPKDRFVEIAYEDLDAAPLGAVKTVYDALKIDGFEAAKPAFEAYLGSVESFQKNKFAYSDEAAEKVEAHWGQWVRRWGYSRPGA